MRRLAALIVVYVVIALLVYGSSLGNGFVNFDDITLVLQNPAVHTITPASLKFIFTHYDPELYIPLTFLSYQIDHLIGGLSPWIYHVTNLILHIINALLVTWIATQWGKRVLIGVFVGMLFLVHPLHVETVAWIAARKDLLSTMFFLLSLGLWLQYRHHKKNQYRWWSIGTFVLGLLSKVQVVVLPALFLLDEWKERRKISHVFVSQLWPFLVAAAVFIVVAVLGKTSVLSDSSPVQGIVMAFRSTAFYVGRLIAPRDLSVLYPYTEPITIASQDMFLSMVAILILTGLVIYSIRWTREIAFGYAFFLITLAPTFTNYAKAGDFYFASDRYAYVPSIGLFYAVGFLLWHVFIERSQGLARKRFITAGLFLLIALTLTFGIYSHRRAAQWIDSETLFTDVLSKYPNAHIAHEKIGAIQFDRGELEAARASFEASHAIRENERAYYHLGLLLLQEERWDEALELNLKALAINPDYVPAIVNVGYLRARQGETLSAIVHFERAVRLDPSDFDAKINLAVLLLQQGDAVRARALAEEVLALDGTNEDALAIVHGAQ